MVCNRQMLYEPCVRIYIYIYGLAREHYTRYTATTAITGAAVFIFDDGPENRRGRSG